MSRGPSSDMVSSFVSVWFVVSREEGRRKVRSVGPEAAAGRRVAEEVEGPVVALQLSTGRSAAGAPRDLGQKTW